MKPAMTPQQAKFSDNKGSALQLYRELVTGNQSLIYFVYFEFVTTFFSSIPGLLGLAFRKLFYAPLFKKAGTKIIFGRSMLIRCARQVSLGRGIIFDDYTALDLRGATAQIDIGNNVVIGRYSSIIAKDAKIKIGNGVNISSSCRIASQSKIEIGESTLIAAYAYIGPGNHQLGSDETPLIEQKMEIKDGVYIGEHVWIGTRATIMDGVKIGKGSIIAAHSFVNSDVPEHTIVAGVPAKVVKHLK